MRTHSQITTKLMRRPGVRGEVERIEREEGALPDQLSKARQDGGLTRVQVAQRNGTQALSRLAMPKIVAGSTNVYADLGYADAAEMQRKSQLAAEIARAIKARRLTQGGAAELLGIDQSKVSRITRGQFRGVSEAKLLELVAKLGHDVKIVVGPVRRRAGKIELQFA